MNERLATEESGSGIHIVSKLDVLPPQKANAYPIPVSDWEYLKKKVKRIESSGGFFHSVAFLLFGAAITAGLSALTLPDEIITHIGAKTSTVCWTIGGVFFLVGLLCLYFSSRQSKSATNSKMDVIDEMDRLEERYEKCER